MYGYGSAWRASLVSLECPHCRTPQLRARMPEGTLYTCTACKRTFKAPVAPLKAGKPRKKR
jgi:transposase-like protein